MVVRLMVDGAASGARNMSIDEALLQSAATHSVATLRFYTWQPATLSLGYFQPYADRAQHPQSRSLPCVRRASGGGAIVHDRELTYSFAAPLRDRWLKSEQVVREFHETLIAALADWQIDAELCPRTKTPTPPPFLCFQRRACLDVLLQGHKICGSAQRRNRGAGLLHGSILLHRSAGAAELPGIADLHREPIDLQDLREAWTSVLARVFRWEWATGTLTPAEEEGAERCRQDRFENEDWNRRR